MALFLLSARGASAAGGFVYALNQVDGGPNQIYGFRVNPDVGVLTLLPGFPVASGGLGGPGSFSEHVAFRNGLLFVVNEGSASLSVLSVNPTTGALTAAPFSPITLGGDLACVAADPTAAPVVVGANLGGLWSLAITATTATIAPGSPFATPGERPFSCGFSRDGNYVYTGGSGGAGVSGFTVAPDTGVLTPLAGSPFEAGAGNPVGYATDSAGRLFMSNYNSSAVRVFTTSGGILTAAAGNPFPSGLSGGVQGILHPSGFYMVADRLAQQVGVFRIAGSGSSTTLTAVSGSPFGATGGVFTDALTLTAGGAFLVAANGITRNLTIFQVDTATGSLTSLGGQPSDSIGSTGFITGLTFAASGSRSVIGDFDGDAKSDFTVYRPSAGLWAILKSNRNYTTSQSLGWGLSSDVPVPGDYDGDGEIDPAIYRPSTGLWAILKSSTNYTTSMTVTWGISTDVPQAADYDGDGKADPAFYRPSSGAWAYLRSSANYTTSGVVSWGLSSDVPLVGDYDGDGKADPAIFRPSTGLWAFLRSSTNYFASTTVSWGLSTDIPVPGDYDGDGKTDPAIFRPATGVWAILKSSTNYAASATVSWGLSSDAPAPADYDGDGKFDPAVFRASTGNWYVLRSSTNFGSSFGVSWGLSTDTPINKRP
ncbi:MAG TPA: beta-propeller fold lactonase family protein [Vicinamibacterales bacterium]